MTRRPPWASWAAVAGGVLAVRSAVWAGGHGFSTAMLEPPSLWHLLDPVELERNPVAPVWDLHTQPPLFNVVVGAVLRWSPLPDAVSFQVLFTAAAVLGAIALHEVVRMLGCRPWVAVTATLVAFSSPTLVGHESQVMQEPLVVPLLLVTTWACAAYARQPGVGRLAVLAGVGTALALVRPQFHPVWLVAGLALVVAIRPPAGHRRRLLLVAAIPVVALGGLMVKNEVRFGQPTLSSWFGMNLQRTTLVTAPRSQVDQLVAEGHLSSMAREQPFGDYEDYAPYVEPCTSDHGTARLDVPAKSDGTPNYNYACFVPVYSRAQRDALAFIGQAPGTYLRSVGGNTTLYLAAPIDPDLTGGPGGVLEDVHGALALEVETSATYPAGAIDGVRLQVTVVVTLAAVIGAGAWALVLAGRGTRTPTVAVVSFVGFTAAFVTATSVLFDAFENARFRSPLDPLLWAAAAGVVLEAGTRRVRRASLTDRQMPTPPDGRAAARVHRGDP